jgi:branched-chain amino acid transport system substrate-binding protein
MFSPRLRAMLLGASVLILAGCQQSASVGDNQTEPMIANPTSVGEAGTGRTPPIEQLPPVSGPRTAPPPDLPVTTNAPQARAGEPLPSLAELLNRPPRASAQTQIMTSTVPMANLGSVRVALLVPLSGPASNIGESMLNAAQMALFQFADERFELLPHDTGGTPEGAYKAAQLAIGDGAKLILGPLLAGSVEAIRPIAQAANVPIVAFSSDKTVAGLGAYVMGFLPSAETERVTRYAIGRGLTRFGLLAPDNAYGVTVLQAMQETALASGVEITKARFYDPLGEDFTDVVREISDFEMRQRELRRQIAELQGRDDELSKKTLERLEQLQTAGDLPFDALMVADGGRRLQQIAALLPFFDVDPAVVQVLGTGQMDQPGLGNEPALLGAWFAAPNPNARTEFIDEYQSIFGKTPHRLATLSYDATALATVLGSGQGGPDFTAAALASPNGYWGRDGIFRLMPDGTTDRGLAVLEVGRRDMRVIDAAPETFQAPLN